MKISKFEDLTQFVNNEYQKMVESYNVQRPSNDFMEYIENTLKKYTKLYDGPLYKLQKQEVKNMYFVEKRELAINKAFDTMPHGKIWKFFNRDLWRRVKNRDVSLKENEEMIKKEPKKDIQLKVETLVPSIVVKDFLPPVPVEDEAIIIETP